MNLTIQTIVAIAGMSIANASYAAPPLDLVGHNDVGERIKVYGEHNGQVHSVILIKKDGNETLLVNQSCSHGGDTFSCAAGGSSPLAGAFYRFKEYPGPEGVHTGNCGDIAACERGCGPRTPRELVQSYECNNVGGCPNLNTEGESWHLVSTNGTVKGTNINLRDNPHTQSRILRTIARGTKIKVVDSFNVCLEIGGKRGVWIFATVSDGIDPKQGWIFDANIDFQKR